MPIYDIKFNPSFYIDSAGSLSGISATPLEATGADTRVSNKEMQRAVEEMYLCQQQLEAKLLETQTALNQAEAARTQRAAELTVLDNAMSTNTLLRSLVEALAA